MAQYSLNNAEGGGVAAGSPKVLLVDDYGPNVMIAGTYLESFGYGYDVSENGIDAIQKAKTDAYFAILMDIQMPTMDGIETATHIRNFERLSGRARLPIIALTAHYLTADRDTCLRAGMDSYMTKPFRPDELKQLLQGFHQARVPAEAF